MKIFKNEKGYTLLFTFAAIVLFSILGLSLITLTSNGVSRNEVRQSTSQSHDLAEKGITYFSEHLNTELEKKIDDIKTKVNKNVEVKKHFNDLAALYACKGLTNDDSPNIVYSTDKFKTIESDLGTTNVCILKIEPSPTNEYSRLITFKSIGTVKGETNETTFESTSEVGYSYVPEALNYAVSTNESGNLYMFGGIQIEGNVKASNDIYVSNKAFWSNTNSPRWVQSVLPRVKSIDGITQPKVYAKNVYRINDSSSNPLTPSSVITKENPNITKTKITDSTISNAFHTLNGEPTPILANEKADGSRIEVSNIVSTTSGIPDNGKYKNVQISRYNGNFVGATSTNAIKKYEVGDEKALYISGNMNIGRYSLNGNYSNDSSQYNDFELNGNYYVEKNLVISGAKLKGNAVIYVKGSVDIEYSTINAGPNEQNNTIFIFAEKPIEIHNISVNSSPGIEGNLESKGGGSVINGFFYTNSNFLMYGVGSNTRITGGVSAKHTTFTALRGHGVDELNKNRSDNTIIEGSDSCTTGSGGAHCACDKNTGDEDRENSYWNQFEMIDKESLKNHLNTQKKSIGFIDFNREYKERFNENIERIKLLIDIPQGALAREATDNDLGKSLYIKNKEQKDSRDRTIYTWETSTRQIVTKEHTNSDNPFYVKEYNFTPFYWQTWFNSLNSTLNEIKNTHPDLLILSIILNDIYGNNKEESKDQCLVDREQNDKGKPNNNHNNSIVGGYNYTSRLTIIYNNDLIKRYTDTNAIEIENAEITVIPTNVKDLKIH